MRELEYRVKYLIIDQIEKKIEKTKERWGDFRQVVNEDDMYFFNLDIHFHYLTVQIYFKNNLIKA